MINGLFSIPVYHGQIKNKKEVDELFSNIVFEDYVKYTRDETSANHHWGCSVYTGHAEELITAETDWINQFLFLIKDEFVEYQSVIENGSANHSYATSIWINIYGNGDHQETHEHIGAKSIISFSYVMKQPENGGRFEFLNPNRNLLKASDKDNVITGHESVSMDAREGDIIIFPSWLEHRVTHNNSNEKRMSISGNAYVERI